MSNYTKFNAATDIAAAYSAVLSAQTSVIAAQRTRMTSNGLTNAVFGKGHPPRGIPL